MKAKYQICIYDDQTEELLRKFDVSEAEGEAVFRSFTNKDHDCIELAKNTYLERTAILDEEVVRDFFNTYSRNITVSKKTQELIEVIVAFGATEFESVQNVLDVALYLLREREYKKALQQLNKARSEDNGND